jgi:hypothetical protein
MMSKSLYDAMPYAYMAIGALITALMDTPLKYLPAALFVSAGLLVFSWRHLGMRPRRQPPAHSPHRPQPRRH